jgi:hypothetical protein
METPTPIRRRRRRVEIDPGRHNVRAMDAYHGTTIVSVRRGGQVALGGDGQVTIGNIVAKATARKVRRLHHDKVLASSSASRPSSKSTRATSSARPSS